MAFGCLFNFVTKLKSHKTTFCFHGYFYNSLRFHHVKRTLVYNFKRLKQCVVLVSSVSASMGLVYYWNSQKQIFCQVDSTEHENTNLDVCGKYETAISKCRDIIQRLKDEAGCPGIVIGVSVDGKNVWNEGFGYSDIENRVPCTPNTVMRIASISKSITMTAVGKLWEENKLDFDKPVQFYVPYFPLKKYNGEQVEITCRQLLSHLAGIRHYSKDIGKLKEDKVTSSDKSKKHQWTQIMEKENTVEFDHKEYYIKDKYEDIKSAVSLFQDDVLISKPGSKFNYSTHGWTLVSAIVEKAVNEPFTNYMTKLFKSLGMINTYLDVNDALIYHRSRYYVKNKKGHLINAPYVDNSYKWAGGGFQSTVGDLLLFGNSMLYSLQCEIESSVQDDRKEQTATSSEHNHLTYLSQNTKIVEKQTKLKMPVSKLPGFLKSNTVKTMWTPVTHVANAEWMYAMGWYVLPEKQECEYCLIQPFAAAHTGGAIGASSVLLILPKKCSKTNPIDCQWDTPPKGIVVVILTNLQEVGMKKQAYEIAKIFNTFT